MKRAGWSMGLGFGLCLVGCGDDGRAGSDVTSNSGATISTTGDTNAVPTEGGSETAEQPTTSSAGSVSASAGETTSSTGDDTLGTTEGDTTSDTATTEGVMCPADCEDKGGVCLGGECCPADLACDGICCPSEQVCSFNKCETPGAECIDASECSEDEYCEYSLGDPEMANGEMCQGGVSLATGKCLPSPPDCRDGVELEEGEPITCLPKCEYIPDGSFDPEVKYHWDKFDVMMAPIVVQLDDDNCDGVVDERDIPEIVFNTFLTNQYNVNGTTWAISIIDGQIVDKWSFHTVNDPTNPGREVAGGNIDGKPGNEIVTCTTSGRVRALTSEGQELWITAEPITCVSPAIADLDGDGIAEVIVTGGIIDGATGTIKVKYSSASDVFAADLNVDGELDIVQPLGAFTGGGGILAQTGMEGRFAAIADFDHDGKPEVAVIANGGANWKHHLLIWRYDEDSPNKTQIVRQPIDINGPLSKALCPQGSAGNVNGGGPPTIADFNGDGTPDVAVAGGIGYAVFDGKKLLDPDVAGPDTFMWIKQTKDCSSAATGSSVFDFDGDGSAEVLYGDEHELRIYRGSDGEVLWSTCNTSGTLRELPVVADVDNDGHADIVAIANSYSGFTCNGTKQRGVRVFGDKAGQWVRTRRVWNQHAYSVTNIQEDGNLPVPQPLNWTTPGLNNFRQNAQPLGEFNAPDLIVSLRQQCPPLDYGLVARVRNIGSASVPAGVPVRFYEGDPKLDGMLLGASVTSKVLYPAEAEDVVLLLPDAAPGIVDGTSELWVVVDDEMPDHAWHECRTDNNSAKGDGQCPMPG